MNATWLRIISLAIALLSRAAFVVRGGAREPSDARHGHLSGLAARITMADGSGRVARLEGVGCSASICSRTLIKGRTDRETLVKTWLDFIAAIKAHCGRRPVCIE